MKTLMLLTLCFTYHIGNSLTTDTVTQADNRHTKGGYAIHTLWNDPNTYDVAVPDNWPNVSPTTITLQPHPSQGSTLALDEQHIGLFQNLYGNPHTILFQTWPSQLVWSPTYSDYWTSSWGGTLTEQNRDYWDNIDGDFWIAPMGEVLYELEQLGYDLTTFYRDNLHISVLGKPIVNYTWRTTFAGTSREPLNGLDPNIAAVVWDIVANHPRSGYADFNNDQEIDAADLAAWDSTYGTSRDGLDFLVWQRTTGTPAGVTATPEPSSFLLMSLPLLVGFYATKGFQSQWP